MNTAYIDREDTNENRNATRRKEKDNHTIQGNIPQNENETSRTNHTNNPMYNSSFQNQQLRKWILNKRIVGRPRASWTEEAVNEIWDYITKDHDQDLCLAFDAENEYIINEIHEAAENDNIVKKETNPRPRQRRNNTQTQNTTNHQPNTQTQPANPATIPTPSEHRNRLCTEQPEDHRRRLCTN